MQLPVNHANDMKTPTPKPSELKTPSLFQIASYFEDFFPAGGLKRPMAQLKQTPFAEWLLQPEKLMAVLNSPTIRNSASGVGQFFRPGT